MSEKDSEESDADIGNLDALEEYEDFFQLPEIQDLLNHESQENDSVTSISEKQTDTKSKQTESIKHKNVSSGDKDLSVRAECTSSQCVSNKELEEKSEKLTRRKVEILNCRNDSDTKLMQKLDGGNLPVLETNEGTKTVKIEHAQNKEELKSQNQLESQRVRDSGTTRGSNLRKLKCKRCGHRSNSGNHRLQSNSVVCNVGSEIKYACAEPEPRERPKLHSQGVSKHRHPFHIKTKDKSAISGSIEREELNVRDHGSSEPAQQRLEQFRLTSPSEKYVSNKEKCQLRYKNEYQLEHKNIVRRDSRYVGSEDETAKRRLNEDWKRRNYRSLKSTNEHSVSGYLSPVSQDSRSSSHSSRSLTHSPSLEREYSPSTSSSRTSYSPSPKRSRNSSQCSEDREGSFLPDWLPLRQRGQDWLPPRRRGHISVCSTVLWYGNVSYEVTEDHLRTVFSRYGGVRNIDVDVARQCAFITMDHRKDAVTVMNVFQGLTAQSKLSWAKGDGVKKLVYLRFWDGFKGVTYIPHDLVDTREELQKLTDGGYIDVGSLPYQLLPELPANERSGIVDHLHAHPSSGVNLNLPTSTYAPATGCFVSPSTSLSVDTSQPPLSSFYTHLPVAPVSYFNVPPPLTNLPYPTAPLYPGVTHEF